MTLLRSTRSFLAPEAVSLNTPTILCPARLAKALKSRSWRTHDCADATVDGNLSQLNPPANWPVSASKFVYGAKPTVVDADATEGARRRSAGCKFNHNEERAG